MHGNPGPGERCCERKQSGAGRGTLVEPAALAALLASAKHGYDLRRAITQITDGLIEADAGGLYRVLRRMEEDGFVTSSWAEGDSGPQRREYELTAEGLDLAAAWVVHLRQRQHVTGMLADTIEASLAGDAPSNDKQ